MKHSFLLYRMLKKGISVFSVFALLFTSVVFSQSASGSFDPQEQPDQILFIEPDGKEYFRYNNNPDIPIQFVPEVGMFKRLEENEITPQNVTTSEVEYAVGHFIRDDSIPTDSIIAEDGDIIIMETYLGNIGGDTMTETLTFSIQTEAEDGGSLDNIDVFFLNCGQNGPGDHEAICSDFENGSITVTGLGPDQYLVIGYRKTVSNSDVCVNKTSDIIEKATLSNGQSDQSTITVIGPTGTDTDGDCIRDNDDNCPSNANPDQADGDGDGIGDVCDACAADADNDADGDGVCGNVDNCPGTPSGESVDEDGCSDSQKDSDGDGVPDDVDNCPGTPSGESVDR
jgi:hypothetical protein